MAKSSADMLKSTRPGVMSGHLLNGVRVSHQEAQSDWDSLANTRDDVVRIDVPADPQERMAFVRRWMANNQKALKQGGMAATLVLPLLAQQALADPMVAVNDLQGVAEVIRQPNGSLTLIMNSGQRIDMAAADVALENGRVVVDIDSLMELLGNDSGLLVPLSQLPDVQTWELLPDGNVLITRPDGTQMVIERGALVQQGDLFLISPSNALQQGIASGEDFGNLLFVPSASFANQPSSTSSFPSTASSSSEPVSSFGDIPPWLYVGGGAIAVGAAAAGGGGGGGGSDGGPATISGYVIDGYISGATVTRAVNSNQVTTNDDGFFSGLQGSGILTATGGVDISTGLPFTGVLRAPEDATVITPLTTLMVQLSQQFGLNDADAQTAIKTALGLDQRIDLMTTDPLAEASPNLDLLIAGVKVASLLAMAATAGISSADALSRLGTAFNQASDAGRELTNQEMADALGLPSIAGQVKQALDAIDNASDGLNIDAYRDGNNNPLRDAQRNAQDPNSDLSDTIGTRAEVPYLTLQQAVALAANDELPANYLINPNQPFAAGTLGLTAAGNQLALVETVLAGDFDVATAPIALGDIYTWSIRADAEDVLVSGGLGRPEVVGAQSVTLTNTTIRPDQFADLNTLDNFDLGSTVVPYTLEQALATDVMPANYTLNPSRPFSAGDLTVREAAELIDSTRVLLDLAQNTDSDNLTRDLLLEWNIVDSLATILGTPSARPQIAEANSISVTEAIITPAQFVQLNALPNFVLGETEVDYTLAEALAADPLASNYIIDLQEVLSAGTVTVAQAETAFADVSRVLEGANNQPPLTLFEWVIRDTADAIIADLDQGHVTEANQVSASNRVISSAQFDQLNTLDNFELGTTIVRYTLENAVNADALAANYDIDTTVPFEAGEVSVDAAATTLAAVERILDGALNTQTPNADALFNWTVVDSASAILAAGNVPHLTRADAVNVSDDIITIAQFEALSTADFNYIRLGELVEYTLANAISVIDAGNGPLVADYVIDLETSFNDVWTVAQGASYFAIIAGAENRTALLGSDAVVWQVEDSIGNLLDGISNVNAGDTAFGDDAVVNAQTVRVTGTTITQAQYEELLAAVGDALSLEAGENAARTTVTYADLAAAVSAQANGVLAPSDFYSITANTTYTNTNGALSVANALTEIETVKSILAGARNTLNFETVYEWSITDSASNILGVITNGVPDEVLAGADSILAANGGPNGNILAAEYDALVNGLGEGGFDYNEVSYTLAYVFDEEAETFAAPGDLADRFFFTLDKFDIDEAVGEGNINVADAAGYYNAVLALVNASTDTLSVTDIYEWSVLDSAAAIVTAYTNNGNQHPPHIRDATLVEINDTAVITFDQYGILEQIPGFEIQSYTLEDAVGIYLEDNSGLATNYIIDTEQPYQAQNLSVADALTYRNAVDVLLGGTDSAARNTQVDGTTLDGLYSWTIEDSAENILAQKSGTEFPPIISEALNITLTDASIVFEDEYLNGLEGLLTPSDLVNVRVDFYYDEDIDITFIENEEFENNYGVLANANGPLEYVGVSSATAEAEYQRVFDVVDGASNVPPVNIESLVVWTIEDSVENIDVDAPWVELAQAIQLTETELTASQFLKFVTVADNEVSVLNTLQTSTLTNVSFTPQEAYDNRIAFLDIASSNPGYSLSILSAPVVAFATPFNVADANTLDATLDDLINAAGTAPSKLDAYSWRVEDSATNLLDDVSGEVIVRDDAGIQNASEVRVTDSEISISQYEALVQLDTFVDAGFVVGYSLEEALDRLPSEFGLAENYTLIDATPFDIGELNAYDAQRIYQLVERLIDGAQNGADVSVDSLMDWVVKDTLAGYEDIGITTNNDYLREADGVIITGSGVNGEIENGEGQANRQAFSGTDIAYTEEAGFPASPYSLTYTLNGSETLGDPIIDFSTGAGGDQLIVELMNDEFNSLRGDGSGFANYDTAQALGANEAFVVFSAEEFVNDGASWLANLGLGTGNVVYLLAGNGDTVDINDDALLFRVEESDTSFDTQLIANFENIDLNNFEEVNTNYSIIT
ncbi:MULTISPECIES: calcium-binding protein [unclassified Halomonas]|uniref:calcium-binding protein n=1 Tax=unclassified Halomonas TaxID=2609666 RepID=UPI001EF7053D|nr:MULTISPECIES: calcium-binding protein [unclassified Halomonas]MCG7575754.1 calcium-binding protein [Halomonas sp. MMH1-48]MCG7602816.1 calcium-binding protein [Halomonas sp. MM17-34]MCG7612145.1 calcium-binding protein [Halomonas sp. MM17-29]MCG7619026.1 calcium-binding protein [Halomonas sp. DSH1-27]